jgi:hypothetical protein
VKGVQGEILYLNHTNTNMAQICSLFLLILLAFPPVQCVSSLTKNTEGNDSIRTADGKIADSRVLVNDPMKQLLFGDRKRHKKKPIHGSTDELEADADAAAAASDPNAAGLNDPIEMRQSRHGAKTHKLRKERRSSSGDNDFNMGHIRAHEGGRMGGRGGSRAGGRLGGRGRGVGRAGGRAGVRVTHPPGPGSRNHQQLAGHGPFGGQPFPTIGFTDLSMRAHPAPGFPGSHTQPKPLPLPQARPVPKDGEIVRGIWDNRQQRTPGGQLFKHEVRIYTDTHEKSLRAALPDKNNELPIKGMIFTAFLRSQKDPQRGKWIDASMSYIHNVYTSIRYLDLRATFFHDNCSDAFVNRYSTDKIQFRKIKVGQ